MYKKVNEDKKSDKNNKNRIMKQYPNGYKKGVVIMKNVLKRGNT